MEEIKKCKNCGTQLLDSDNYCPICGMEQDDENMETELFEGGEVEKKSYWKNRVIWTIALVLLVASGAINIYLSKNPIKLAKSDNASEKVNKKSDMTIKGRNSYYQQATNSNMLGVSYVNKDKFYVMMNDELLVYDKELKNQEVLFDHRVTSFSEDDKYYYYLNEKNDYCRVEKSNKEEVVLLTNAYYVQNLGEKIYYQKDSDNESIYCFDVATKEDVKLNTEVSYSIIVDKEKSRIFYINANSELISIAIDGSDRKALASNTNVYTYDGNYLYYINEKGVIRCNLDGNHEEIYEKSNLSMVNIVDEHLVIHDDNTIYTMDMNGEKVNKLYTIEATGRLTFEVVGDKILVLCSSYIVKSTEYEMIGLDGKRKLLESNNKSGLIGEEI